MLQFVFQTVDVFPVGSGLLFGSLKVFVPTENAFFFTEGAAGNGTADV